MSMNEPTFVPTGTSLDRDESEWTRLEQRRRDRRERRRQSGILARLRRRFRQWMSYDNTRQGE